MEDLKSFKRFVAFVITFALFSQTAFALTFTVNSTGDGSDDIPGNGACLSSGVCTLRAAIQEANASAGDHTINMTSTLKTITASNGKYPTITRTKLRINGSVSAGDIVVDGNGTGSTSQFFLPITANSVSLSDMVIYNSNSKGIYVDGSSNVSITRVITGISGSLGSAGSVTLQGGVLLSNTTNATLRSVTAASADGDGIAVFSASGTSIINSFAGTHAGGTNTRANAQHGISIAGNTGGLNTINGSVVSGNGVGGIVFSGTGTLGGTWWLWGNKVGVDATGNRGPGDSGYVDMGNGTNGVYAKTNPSSVLNLTIGNNRDGSNDSNEGNVISDNAQSGIDIRNGSSVVISGNTIGVDEDGMDHIRNGANGIIVNATTVDIGTDNDGDATDDREANVISGNVNWGINVNGTTTSTIKIRGNTIGGNSSGTSSDGDATAGDDTMTNSDGGILISASNASTLVIGERGASVNSTGSNFIINNGGGIKITELKTSPVADVKIQNNYIGVQKNGSVTAGNIIPGGFNDGIEFNLTTGLANLLIGLNTASITKTNIIAANQKGIDIGAGANTINIAGNAIGAILNAAANAYVKDGGNLAHGIFISATNADLSKVNIGSSTGTEYGNTIGANNSGGLYIGNAGDTTTPAQVAININRFGLGSDGTTVLSNGRTGVYIAGNVATITMTSNIIAHSTGTGVDIAGGTALAFYLNTVGAGGTAAATIGTVAAGNGKHGLYIHSTRLTSAIIGGATAALGNIFAANRNEGIFIEQLAADTTSATIKGNFIGVCAKPSTGSISTTNLSSCRNVGAGINVKRGIVQIGGDNSLGSTGTGTIAEGNVIAGNIDGAIKIMDNDHPGQGVSTASILGNMIGVIRTTANGIFNTANANSTLVGGSIVVSSNSIGTLTIGDVGTTVASSKRNVISATTGTNGDGVNILDMDSNGTSYFKNNYIGTDWTGATALGNKRNGISIGDGTLAIGGTGTNTGNLISGNTLSGIFISGSAVDGTNTIRGNKIGLNAAGDTDKGNTLMGIYIAKLASGSTLTIGGTETAARNYVSGNDNTGILDLAASTHTTNIYNNYVGLNVAGTAAIGNIYNGIVISSTSVTVNIGDSTGSTAARNIVSGNGGTKGDGLGAGGITLNAANTAVVKGNYIGVAADGTTRIPNYDYELWADGDVGTLTIGGSGNKINNTDNVGVFLLGKTATNEATMDTDNTWTDMVVNSGDYDFWKRYSSDALSLINFGPQDCYDGVDNDGDSQTDYSSDPGCSSMRDDSEGSEGAEGAPFVGGGGGNEAGGNEDGDEEDAGEDDNGPPPQPPSPQSPEEPPQPQTPTPPQPEQPPADPEDARKKLLDAASTVVDTVSGARQAKAKIEDVMTLIEGTEEKEGIVVKKTEEQLLLEDTLEQAMAGEVTEEEIEKVETVAVEILNQSIDEYLDRLEAKGGQFAVTVGGKERVITEDTEFEVELWSQKDAFANQEAFDEAGENKFVIGPSTILTGDVAEILKLQEGAPFDGEKLADKVFVLGLPGLSHPGKTIEDFLPEKAAVTSPADGQEVSMEFLIWAVSPKKNDVLSFFLVDRVDPDDNKTWQMYDLGEVTADEYKVAAMLDLTDKNLELSGKKEFDLVILNEEGEGSSVKVIVNPTLEFQASEVKLSRGEVIELGQPEEREDISDILHTSVLLASAKVVEENIDANIVRQEPVRKLTGYIPDAPGSTVFITWKSVVMNSVVVADASQGYFEVEMPERLAQGDHEVLVYAYNKKKNWTSSVRSLLFNR